MAKKLSQWAKDNNYSYGGALKAFHRGDIPGAFQLESGTILVEEEIEKGASTSKNRAALYSRVSTRKQDESLKKSIRKIEFIRFRQRFSGCKRCSRDWFRFKRKSKKNCILYLTTTKNGMF